MKQNRFRVTAALLMLLSGVVPAAIGQDVTKDGFQEQVKRVSELYAPDSWPASESRVGFALGELTVAGYEGEPLRDLDGVVQRRFAGEEGLPPFVVELEVHASAAEARQVLLLWLAGLSSVAKAPSAAELDMAVGDAAYVGLSGAGPGAISWFAFVRGNVAVRLLADDPRLRPQPNLAAVARKIDRGILAAPELAEDSAPPRPAILELAAEKTACVAGEIIPLELVVADPAGEPALVTWTVGGPGQGYVERREDGVWKLYTTGPGAIHLVATVTGRMGTSSSQAIDLEVADD